LAVTWGGYVQIGMRRYPGHLDGNDQVEKTKSFAAKAPAALIQSFSTAINALVENYNSWKVEWGEINRFQRISPDIDNKFDDSKPSIAVGFVSSQWGMLPSFASSSFGGTKKRYGYNGNSFICAVEFGKRVRAKSLLTGGESGDPHSPHFDDQATMYTKGQFKDVLFYKEDVIKHAEKTYHPGE
jgi:acyl-homoserine lactone acylase PvdQ